MLAPTWEFGRLFVGVIHCPLYLHTHCAHPTRRSSGTGPAASRRRHRACRAAGEQAGALSHALMVAAQCRCPYASIRRRLSSDDRLWRVPPPSVPHCCRSGGCSRLLPVREWLHGLGTWTGIRGRVPQPARSRARSSATRPALCSHVRCWLRRNRARRMTEGSIRHFDDEVRHET